MWSRQNVLKRTISLARKGAMTASTAVEEEGEEEGVPDVLGPLDLLLFAVFIVQWKLKSKNLYEAVHKMSYFFLPSW
jgi:hypothetical protein